VGQELNRLRLQEDLIPSSADPQNAEQSKEDASALRSLQHPASQGEDCLHARNKSAGAQRCPQALHREGDNPRTSFLVGRSQRLVLCLETHLEMSILTMAQAGGPSAQALVLVEDSEGFTTGPGEAVVVQDLSEFP